MNYEVYTRKSKRNPETPQLQGKEKARLVEILNTPEVYDFSKFKKTRTVQSDELNFYVPEKWKR
ncbi:hypothetical protein Trichorick_01399 (plasmid) [Candidatus Trichorickettsia mobilis]|uniref:Uncharacterized protein n=1 Tax=Candidatus Trichorickettsia mobilis TaxID=1346319 RepID=A0ABZ0UV46_9RICK|nr:hypothetical protein Trichorick_01399 [Candidatus Trichorickettsia mobilis]